MKKKSKNFSAENNVSGGALLDRLQAACKGWFYMSETDAEVEPFFHGKAGEATKGIILKVTGNSERAEIEEGDITAFFNHLWRMEDGGPERTPTRPVHYLRQFLEQNLTDLKVFRIGRIRLDVYVVGLDSEGNLAGVKTVAVET
jgi:hypothetical protein